MINIETRDKSVYDETNLYANLKQRDFKVKNLSNFYSGGKLEGSVFYCFFNNLRLDNIYTIDFRFKKTDDMSFVFLDKNFNEVLSVYEQNDLFFVSNSHGDDFEIGTFSATEFNHLELNIKDSYLSIYLNGECIKEFFPFQENKCVENLLISSTEDIRHFNFVYDYMFLKTIRDE